MGLLMKNKKILGIIIIALIAIILLYFFVFKTPNLKEIKDKIAAAALNNGIQIVDIEKGTITYRDKDDRLKMKVSSEKLEQFKKELLSMQKELTKDVKTQEEKEDINKLINIYINLTDLPLRKHDIAIMFEDTILSDTNSVCFMTSFLDTLTLEQLEIYSFAASIEIESSDFYNKTHIKTADLNSAKELEEFEKMKGTIHIIEVACT